MSSIRKLFIQFSYFITGNLFSVIVGLISFPILTRILTREEYGILGLVTVTMTFSFALAKAGMSNGIIRFYEEYREPRGKCITFSSTVMIVGILLSGMIALLYLLSLSILNNYLKVRSEFLICFKIMGIYLFLRPINSIVLNFLRVNGKIRLLTMIGIVEKMMSTGLSLTLLIFIFRKLSGYFLGIICVELLLTAGLFYWFLTNYKVSTKRLSKDLGTKLLRFGYPLIFTEIAYLLLSYVDRYIIVAYSGEDVLGLYTVGYNLAMYIVNIIMFSMSFAIVPIYVEIYEKEGRERTEEFLKKCLRYLVILILPICFGYYAISRDLFVLLASEKYIDASTFSPVILIGTVLLELNNIFNAGLYLRRKTGVMFLIMMVGVVINIGLNIVLLPLYGVMGAAVATLGACVIVSGVTIFVSRRYISVNVDLRTIIFYSALSVLMVLIVSHLGGNGVWIDLGTKILAGSAIILVGVLFREREIVEKLRVIYRDKVGHLARRI